MFQSCHSIIRRITGLRRDDQMQRKQDEEPNSAQRAERDSKSTEYLVHNWLEALFAWFQVIVLWHEPQISVCAIAGLLSSFLLLTYFAPSFYVIFLLAMFIYNLNKFWFRHVWPEIRVPPSGEREEELRLDIDRWTYLHPQLMTLKELKYHIRNLTRLFEGHIQDQLQMRRHSPVRFCLKLCCIFLTTAYLVGQVISGLTLVFSALVIIISAPGAYVHLLPEQYKCQLKNKYQSLLAQIEHTDAGGELGAGAEIGDARNASTPLGSRETIATSVANTMKSIESLFGNLKRKTQGTAPTSHSSTSSSSSSSSSSPTPESETNLIQPEDRTQQQQQPLSGTTVISHLREDGAKALYNLFDVTLKAVAGKDPQRTGAGAESHESSPVLEAERSGVDESSAAEPIPPMDNEDDQQDDGFVML